MSINYIAIHFLDYPSLIFILALAAVVVAVTGSFKTLIMGTNCVMSKRYQISEQNRQKAIDVFIMLRRVLTSAGIVIFTFGMVLALGSLGDPDALGPNLAVALISQFYAQLLNLFFVNPAIYILQTRKGYE